MSAWAGFMPKSRQPPPAPSSPVKALRNLGTSLLIPPWLCCVLFYFIVVFFISSRPCSRESFGLYSNTSLNRQEAALISMRCVYHLSPGILIYTAVKNLAPNVFYFKPQRRGCAKGLSVLASLFHLGVACMEGHQKENPPKPELTVFNHVSSG